MGRDATGAQTCEEVKRIELSYLLKQGYLVKGAMTKGNYSWSRNGEDAGNITIVSVWTKEEIYIRLSYRVTDRYGEVSKYDDRIDIVTVPSNLGKGEVLYFLCPVNGRRCRILYQAYGYHNFKSREAYRNRLYYDSQTASKLGYASTRYFKIEKQLNKIYRSGTRDYYKGKKTRTLQRIEKMEADLDHYDNMRLQEMAAMMGVSLNDFLGVDLMNR